VGRVWPRHIGRGRPLNLVVMRHSSQEARVYVLRASATPWDHWGDYADILVHGMTSHLERRSGLLQLERTAPFLRGVTFPGVSDVIVTSPIKSQLNDALPKLDFRPVALRRIVCLDWHLWDKSRKTPLRYPKFGEPEDYILERKHDPEAAAAMGALWELVPEIVPTIQAEGGALCGSSYRGQHFVRADEYGGYNFVSNELREALEAVAPGDVAFDHPEIRE
jgi:hypothetical protein